jgi:hypothetical protein
VRASARMGEQTEARARVHAAAQEESSPCPDPLEAGGTTQEGREKVGASTLEQKLEQRGEGLRMRACVSHRIGHPQAPIHARLRTHRETSK